MKNMKYESDVWPLAVGGYRWGFFAVGPSWIDRSLIELLIIVWIISGRRMDGRRPFGAVCYCFVGFRCLIFSLIWLGRRIVAVQFRPWCGLLRESVAFISRGSVSPDEKKPERWGCVNTCGHMCRIVTSPSFCQFNRKWQSHRNASGINRQNCPVPLQLRRFYSNFFHRHFY